jgi:hypothetical protein
MNPATPERTEHVNALVGAQHAAPQFEEVCK